MRNEVIRVQQKLIRRGDRFKRELQVAAGHVMALCRGDDPEARQRAEDWFDESFRVLMETDDTFFRLPTD